MIRTKGDDAIAGAMVGYRNRMEQKAKKAKLDNTITHTYGASEGECEEVYTKDEAERGLAYLAKTIKKVEELL